MSEEEKKYKIYVSNRDLVTPGDILAEGNVELLNYPYIIKERDHVVSTVVGLVEIQNDNKIGVIPLEGFYYPKEGDIVIGIIEEIGVTHWEVNIRAPYKGVLTATDFLGRPFNPAQEDLSKYLNVGDVIIAKIESFDRTRDPILTIKGKDLGKVTEGTIIEVEPSRVPRIIGKRKSMLNVLTSETNCDIVVAQNGRVLIKCPNEELEAILILAIKKIEKEAHTTGLTERIREFILKQKILKSVIKSGKAE